MRIKKTSKKSWRLYIIRVLIIFIILIGVDYYKETHPKQPEEISAEVIKEGTYKLFTDEQNECGQIIIEKSNDNILINMRGEEIKGVNVIKKPYVLKPVEYNNIKMVPISLGYETYYIYDKEDSYILLFRIRKENTFFIKNYDEKKQNYLFMLCEVTHKTYDFMIDFSDTMELQRYCDTKIDTNRYTCFFVQENPVSGKKNNRFLMKHK